MGNRDDKKVLVGPLSNVKGIGPKTQAQIISARKRGEPISERAMKLMADPKTKIDSLFPISDRFKELLPDPSVKNIHTPPTRIIDAQCKSEKYEVVVFCAIENIKPKDENEEINVARRGYKVKGPTQALNLRLADDTDVIFAKVNRWDYEKFGKPIVERGRAGKALYAIKGSVPKDFRMISITAVKYIGDLEKDEDQVTSEDNTEETND